MNKEELKKVILSALQQARGDDLERAKMKFRYLSAKEMKMQHGASGKTRQEILEGYQQHANKIDETIAYASSL